MSPQAAAPYPITRREARGSWSGDDDARKFQTECEGWFDETGVVVLVEAAGVEEIDVVEGGVCYFYDDVVGVRLGCGHRDCAWG